MHGEFPVYKVLAELSRDNLLPAILFRTSRRQCDVDIDNLAHGRSSQLLPDEQEALVREVDSIIEKYQMEPNVILKHPQYEALVTTGGGAHHAGQLLLWRLLLEELMTRSRLRLMIATGTVAAGVDFPARTVIVTAHSKRGSEGFNVLTSSEFQQMAGRAGRRGKDSVGICLIAPSMYSDARVFLEVSKRPPEPLRSAYFAAPATVLNLLKYRNVDDLRYTVHRSLAAFLDRKSGRGLRESAAQDEAELATKTLPRDAMKKAVKRVHRKVKEAELLEQKQDLQLEQSLQGLTALGYVEGSGLTEKGSWAANLCTSLVLELGEAIADRLFDELTEDEFIACVASIAGDPHRPYFSLKSNPLKREHFKKLEAIVLRVKTSYQNPQSNGVTVLPDAALTVLTWLDSENWESFSGLLRLAGVAEGDVARLVMQTADHLNQISRLKETHPHLAEMASNGRVRLLKPPLTEPVVAS